MAKDKIYHWLKLQEDFFEDDTMIWLKEQENGTEYIVLYLQLCLKSLFNDGKLFRNVGETIIPYNVEYIAKSTQTNIDVVRVAMSIFAKIGLIGVEEDGIIMINHIDEMVGSETDSARRKRKQRLKESQQKTKALSAPNEVKCDNVTEKSHECPKNVPIEIRDKSLEIRDKSLDVVKQKNSQSSINNNHLSFLKNEFDLELQISTTKKLEKTLNSMDDDTFNLMIRRIKESTWLKDNLSDTLIINKLDSILLGEYRDFKSHKSKDHVWENECSDGYV